APLRRALDGTRPFLGICLGYQLLFTSSEEFGEGHGLDVIPGVVRRFPTGRKVPHMGWNSVEHGGRLRLFEGVPDGARFYFVHSYYPETRTADGATTGAGPLKHAWCDYGVRFAAAVELGRVHATQLHPEKSQGWGLRLPTRRRASAAREGSGSSRVRASTTRSCVGYAARTAARSSSRSMRAARGWR